MTTRTRAVALGVVASALLLGTAPARAENPPGLMFSTLLNGVRLDPRTGELWLDHVQAVFLPDATSRSYYPYNPDDGGRLWAVLADGRGGEVLRFDFYAQKLAAPYWLLDSYKLSGPAAPAGGGGARARIEPGAYTLTFHLDGGPFYTFPFTVAALASDDPFAPGGASFLDGAWERWGYLYYRDANPTMSIQWKVWLRTRGPERSRDAKVRVEVARDGKLLCTSREGVTLSLRQDWVRYELDLISPMEGTSGGAYFKAQDLLAHDGAYTLTMTVDGAPYGTWAFTVRGGKLAYTGRTERGKADPLTFVEGGRDAWWYERR